MKESGFSLVELMVGIAISLLILSYLTMLYLKHLENYRYIQALIDLQDEARIADQFFERDIKMAGFCGCARLDDVSLTNQTTLMPVTAATSLIGLSDTAIPSTLVPFVAEKIQNTDGIFIQYADPAMLPAVTENNYIKVLTKNPFKPGAIVMLANFHAAEIVKLASSYQSQLTPCSPVQTNFQQGSSIGSFHSILYYVAKTARFKKDGNPVYALYRRDLNAATTKQNELLEGVDNLQILYGIFNHMLTSLQYFRATQVKDWRQVRLVKINLLLSSQEKVFKNPQTYQFNNKTILAKDGYLHREWQILVALRQR